MGADSGHHYYSCTGHGGGGRRDAAFGKNFLPTAAGRAWIRPAKAAAAVNLGRLIFVFFRPFQATHTSCPPFLDPLNSFSWSHFADSSPFESYDENKIGQQLDRVFRPLQQLLDQGNGTDEFLVSWAFH